jgi:hypothetical protein
MERLPCSFIAALETIAIPFILLIIALLIIYFVIVFLA